MFPWRTRAPAGQQNFPAMGGIEVVALGKVPMALLPLPRGRNEARASDETETSPSNLISPFVTHSLTSEAACAPRAL